MPLKVVICDDCEKTRQILKCYLEKLNIKEIEIIGEAQDGVELINICKEISPNIILLDIDMPGINGIDAAKKIIEFSPYTSFIFITGYSTYAADSFEVYPADYILKPFSIERLEKSIKHNLKKNFKEGAIDNTITLSFNRKLYTISQNSIVFIERAGRKTVLHTTTKDIGVYESLDSIEQKLDTKMFMRIHRSFIINNNADFKMSSASGRTKGIEFEGHEKIAYVSRKKLKFFKEQLKNKIK